MKHILIVDDEPLTVKALVTVLRQYPQPVGSIRTAADGAQALRMIEESPPDLLLTDIRMPKMDGLELCRQVHERYPRIRKVIISGYGDFEYAQACISYGVKEYILKPFTPAKIHSLLAVLLPKSDSTFSIARFEEHIERIVEAVWALDTPQAEAQLEACRSYCRAASATEAEWANLMDDSLSMIRKRLAQRGFEPPAAAEPMQDAGATDERYIGLYVQVLRWIDELALRRGGQDLMQKAKTYIDEHITREVSLEDVADFLGITPPYLSLLFKKVHKTSFVQYRIAKRIQLAKRLLEVPHHRTNDIAFEVGYENYPHFSRTFKKVTGLSPQEYRSKLGIK